MVAGRRLILFSWHSPASDAIGAQRVRSFASLLPRLGWQVELVTSSDWHAELPPGLRVHVVHDPIARWRRDAGASASRGWRRVVSGVAWRAIVPDEQLVWSMRAARYAKQLPPGLVLTSGPPFSQWLGAARVARTHRSPLIYDYRDLWTQSPYARSSGLRREIEKRLEKRSWRRLTASTAVSEPLSRELERGSGRPSHVVMNGFDWSDVSDQDTPASGPLKLLHTGRLYGGRRDPMPLLLALQSSGLGPDQVQVEFVGPDSDRLREEVRRLSLESMVTVSGEVSRAQALALQAAADVLILLLWNDPREEGVYSGKLFDYAAAKRPLLMLGYEKGVAARLIRERGLGVVANRQDEIASAVETWCREKALGHLRPLPEDALKGLSREEQAVMLSRIVEALL